MYGIEGGFLNNSGLANFNRTGGGDRTFITEVGNAVA